MIASIESSPPPGWDGEGLDGLLAAFLPGRLSEIVGPRSSGGGSLLLALLSRTSARGGLVALVDLLARCPGFEIIALDLGAAAGTAPATWGTRLQRAAEESGAAVIVRTPRHLLGGAAALVVSVRRVRTSWMGMDAPTRLGGLVSEARVLRSRADPRLATPERAWLLEWRT